MRLGSKALFFIFGILFLGSLLVSKASARTDAKTIEFLKQLNLHYYCLSREGLKGFTCEVVVKVSKTYKDSFMALGVGKDVADALDGQRYYLRVSKSEKPEIDWMAPPIGTDGTFDAKLKEQAETLQENFKDTIENWVEATLKPGFDETSFQDNCVVNYTKDGFVVGDKSSDGSSVDIFFDHKARIYKMIMSKNGKQIMEEWPTFIQRATGYLWETATIKAPGPGLRATSRYSYEKVGKYLLLKNAIKDLQLGEKLKKGSSITLDFVNYRLLE